MRFIVVFLLAVSFISLTKDYSLHITLLYNRLCLTSDYIYCLQFSLSPTPHTLFIPNDSKQCQDINDQIFGNVPSECQHGEYQWAETEISLS